MREIKFRVWNSKSKKFFNDIYQIQYQKNGVAVRVKKGTKHTDLIKVKPFILEQFTGLTDKDGVDIYEGDILKVDNNWDEYGFMASAQRQVYFKDGCFRFKPINKNRGRGCVLEDDKEFKIIGNIHQNKDLLK